MGLVLITPAASVIRTRANYPAYSVRSTDMRCLSATILPKPILIEMLARRSRLVHDANANA